MRHPFAQTVSSKDATKIRDLTKRILEKETLGFIPVIITPDVWKTQYRFKRIVEDGITTIFDDSIYLGGKFLTGSSIPERIYIVKSNETEYYIRSYNRPYNAMLATIITSTILEEVVHAVTRRKYPRADAHGKEFYQEYIKLWKKYYDSLHFQMIGIYGLDGDY